MWLVQHDGEEIKQGFTRIDFKAENQANLTLEETSKWPCLEDDIAFALLSTISLHTVVMPNEIHFHGLDAILNGEPIWAKKSC
jgi:hypothetical protein